MPLCTTCAEHWENPIYRFRNQTPRNVAVTLAATLFVAGLIALSVNPIAAGGFFAPAVVLWYVRVVLTDLETKRLAEGNHALIQFSLYGDVMVKKVVEIIDSCTISIAVIAFRTPSGTVFGFGNTKYADEFKRLNSAVEFMIAGPSGSAG